MKKDESIEKSHSLKVKTNIKAGPIVRTTHGGGNPA